MDITTYVYRKRLPDNINGFTAPCAEPYTYTIYVDDRLSQEDAIKAYEHELEHIRRGDFDGDGIVNEIESDTHKGA